MTIVVLVPVLDRPHRVQLLVESLAASCAPGSAWPYFLLSPGDADEEEAVSASGARYSVMEWEAGRGDYARKMNYGFTATTDEFVFLAADDLTFRPGWAEHAIARHHETGACVVGTNDLGNQRVVKGEHSTHSLVHRDYGACGTIDDPSKLLHEGYHHNYVDDEFVDTAKWRGTYAHAADSIVEHLHPNWGKAQNDDTYRRGNEHFNDDRAYYIERTRLWGYA